MKSSSHGKCVLVELFPLARVVLNSCLLGLFRYRHTSDNNERCRHLEREVNVFIPRWSTGGPTSIIFCFFSFQRHLEVRDRERQRERGACSVLITYTNVSLGISNYFIYTHSEICFKHIKLISTCAV